MALAITLLISPIGRIIALFMSFKTLMSDSSKQAKTLAFGILALASAYATLAIVKAFSRSKAEGVALTAIIGASAVGGFFAIKNLSSSIDTASNGTANNLPSTSNLTEQQKNNNNLNASSNLPPLNLTINTNIDGRKVAETTTTYMYNNFKKQNLI